MNFKNFFNTDDSVAEQIFENVLDMLGTLKANYKAAWKEWEQAQLDGDLEKEFNIGEGASDLSERHLGALLAVGLIALQFGYTIEETDGRFRLEKLPDDIDDRATVITSVLVQSAMFIGYPSDIKENVIPELYDSLKGDGND